MVLVAQAGVARRRFIGVEVEGVWVSLCADVVALLFALDTAVMISVSTLDGELRSYCVPRV